MTKTQDIETLLTSFKESGVKQFRSTDICQAVGCTLPTVLSYIKNNPQFISKVHKGLYEFVTQENTIVTESVISQPSTSSTSIVTEEMQTVEEVVDTSYKPLFEW